jgi:O-acetyl-ADP-ribose deacetylase (regulator of RNase III)
VERIELVLGDITRQDDVDALVNAANSTLLGGGGVDGAVHAAGGPELHEACRALRSGAYAHGLPAGQAVSTTGGDLAARWVIHTVGPLYAEGEDRSDVLVSCYRESLAEADRLGARVVAFPAVSTGAYRWPVSDAARIAVTAVRDAATEVRVVRFVLFTPTVHEAFQRAVARHAPDLDASTAADTVDLAEPATAPGASIPTG